jgi:hypothetical protein
LFCNSQHLTQGPDQHTAGELLALYETDQEDFIGQNVIGIRQFHYATGSSQQLPQQGK